METQQLSIPIRVYKADGSDLPEIDRLLVEKAKQATQTSYAAYSKFHVGAALLLENGEIVSGSNQENAAYPAGICAERTAIFYANASQPEVAPVAIAVAAWREEDQSFLDNPISPCGICRQVMVEVETRYQRPLRVLLYGRQGIYEVESASQLLPLCFDSDAL
ncbi:MAG: cytidine deaminase [Bacteroidaceae bacterium]|nr:cytidine deaminase [Bacteroidaceae bacterium]